MYESKEFNYQKGQLTALLKKEYGIPYFKITYEYLSNGKISYQELSITPSTGAVQRLGSGIYTFKNNNLVQNEYAINGFTMTWAYEYDTRNNPFVNIKGINWLFELETGVSANNVMQETYVFYKGNVETTTYS